MSKREDKRLKNPYHRHLAASRAVEKGKLSAAMVAWREFAFEVLGEYPDHKTGLVKGDKEGVRRVAARQRIEVSAAHRIIEHVVAIRPTEGQMPKLPHGAKFIPKEKRRMRVARQVHPMRLYRLAHGLGMNRMCQMMGMSNETLESWESGRTSPSIRKLATLCKMMEVDLDKAVNLWVRWTLMTDQYTEGDASALMEYIWHLNLKGGLA